MFGKDNTPASNRELAPADPALPERYAWLIIDALMDAGLVDRAKAEEAVRIAAVEIQARQSMGDR
jgi:hypothetical protein